MENIFGQNLEKLRLAKNLSKRELSKQIGVTEATISYYESGKRSPSADNLIKISDFFKVSIDVLLRGDVDKIDFRVTHGKTDGGIVTGYIPREQVENFKAVMPHLNKILNAFVENAEKVTADNPVEISYILTKK